VFHPDQFTRYLADGSLDEDYGEGGTSRVEIHGFFPQFRRFTLQPDGKAIIPVDTDHDNGPTSELVRENPDGSVETSFGFGFTVNYGLSSPVVDEQGRITFIGDGTIARLTSDFKLDTTFGDAGRVPIPAGFGPGRLALSADGAIFIGDADGVSRYAQTDPVQLTSDGVLHVEGYGGNDTVTAAMDGRFLNVFFNDEVFTYRASRVTAIGVTTRNGNDTVDRANDRPATVSTSYGNDTIRIAGSAAVVIRSGEGIDFVETGDGADTIHAGGAATILSGAGNDFIGSQEPEGYYLNYPEWGTASYLEVDMGAGDDHILSGVAECFVWGGEGNDLIDNRENFRDEALSRLNGEGGDDTIFGGAGADIVTGGPGVDQIDAREGMNRVDGVTIFGPDFQTTFAGYSLDQSGTLTYTGSAANDSAQVYVNEFNGRLIIWRSARATAADRGVIRRIRMIGGDGNDFIGVNVNTDLPASVEGGGGNDEIAGGMLADVLLGGAGNDSIVGNGGNDTVIAGDGDDSLYGGAGNDDLRGDAGNDYFEGGAGGDTLTGGGGADALFGLAGNDSLLSDGDGVKDTVRGGTGTDSADADDLDDVLGVESVS
jgi:Ca2+-binding RTX toxin-like protein